MQEALVADPWAAVDDDTAVRRAMTDRAAFTALYLRYRDPVFRFLPRRAASADEAADLTATTFERAIGRLPSYRGEGNGFAAWLFRD